MEYETFCRYINRIADIIPFCKEFMFSSVEPLIHPDLFRMMDYLSEMNSHIEFPIQTNGMLLNANIIDQLSYRNVPWVSIALDGITQRSASFFKTGTDFQKVCAHIKMLRKKLPSNRIIRTVFVAHTENISELTRYVRFCKELGVDAIDVNGLFCYNAAFTPYALYGPDGNSDAGKIFQEAKDIGEEIGIHIQVPYLIPHYIGCEWKDVLCIDEEGNVNPCVMLAKKTPFFFLNACTKGSVINFGNILKEEIQDIWNKKEFVNFRDKVNSAQAPMECQLCAEGYGVVCSNR